jgi:hypothetical protein
MAMNRRPPLAGMALSRRRWLVGALALPIAGAWAAPSSSVVEVWKDPNCGCCKDWVAHLAQAGFEVRVSDSGNSGVRARLGIPVRLGSCHTARIGGYAIEGHVPVSEIQRLLRDKPRAVGLSVPGMPLGSPGMDGPAYGGRKNPYDVLLVQADGGSTVYQSYR